MIVLTILPRSYAPGQRGPFGLRWKGTTGPWVTGISNLLPQSIHSTVYLFPSALVISCLFTWIFYYRWDICAMGMNYFPTIYLRKQIKEPLYHWGNKMSDCYLSKQNASLLDIQDMCKAGRGTQFSIVAEPLVCLPAFISSIILAWGFQYWWMPL